MEQQASSSGEPQLECVGSLHVQRDMQLGFVCGSILVPTHTSSPLLSCIPEAAIVPAFSSHNQRAIAPLYRMLPTQTDLNTPLLSDAEEEHISSIDSAIPGGVHNVCMAWGSGYLSHPLAKKCEALAVTGLATYGDDIDVVASVDILKQIFKIPYSKSRVSVAVHRVGRTLILNTGPDMDESEKVVRRKKNRTKVTERNLFWRFAMQSVRAEACDCPPATQSLDPENLSSINISSERPTTDFTAHHFVKSSLDEHHPHNGQQYMFGHEDAIHKCVSNSDGSCSQTSRKGSASWISSHGSRSSIDSLAKSRMVGEQQRDPNFSQSDSEGRKRSNSEGFLRAFFWQLEELRMLLGSDLLLFSNEQHAAVSLHLWEIERQVTPLMWLDIWLDNLMASVPELAICYHHNGIVQGYELLKTDDIYLLKGISKDGTVFFHPHVVQQNALSVLRFLQDNCKQDPGTYWLFKNAGEDLMRLFDLSVISKNCTSCSNEEEKSSGTLPQPKSRGKGNYSLPLVILLYRLAHRLSLSEEAGDKGKCASFFKKCLELLDEQEHLYVRASAHEQVARLILKYYEELGSTLKPLLLDSPTHDDAIIETNSKAAVEDKVQDVKCEMSDYEITNSSVVPNESYLLQMDSPSLIDQETENIKSTSVLETENIESTSVPEHLDSSLNLFPPLSNNEAGYEIEKSTSESATNVCSVPESFLDVNEITVSPISARLTAVHHVSQAIKALRWQRQLQDIGDKIVAPDNGIFCPSKSVHLVPVCVCGEIDCIEIYDIRECEVGSFLDHKLWQLVLLLGESYLALAQAYKEDQQLNRALRAAELACSVYGSIPQDCKEKDILSPYDDNFCRIHLPTPIATNSNKLFPGQDCSHSMYIKDNGAKCSKGICSSFNDQKFLVKGMFWGQIWALVGDIYIDYQVLFTEKSSAMNTAAKKSEHPAMAQEVMKEVKRLRKKLGQTKRNCSICSLINCSCQSDRASSGNSACSSSIGMTIKYPRKQSKKGNKPTSQQLNSSEGLSNVSSRYIKTRMDDDQCVTDEKAAGNSGLTAGSCALTCESTPLVENHRSVSPSSDPIGQPNTAVASDVTEESGDFAAKDNKKKDIFVVLQGPITADLEANFLTAIDCYDAAILAFNELCQDSKELHSVLRKKGWVCNELGRRRLACGNMRSAETILQLAIQAFRDVKDLTNVLLVLCNIGHGKRAAAEALVSQIDNWRASGLSVNLYKQMIEDAKCLYGEALKFYGTAKEELKCAGQDLESTMVDLHNEVYTQCAHTYLRLGMFLATVERAGMDTKAEVSGECKLSEIASSKEQKGVKPATRKLAVSANDSIREAISLYESLSGLRAQEAAFAQFQLACHHRDCCLGIIKTEGKEHATERMESVTFQQAKRYFSLAERYWKKALNHYKPLMHPDMFLEIVAERSSLCMAMAPISYPNSMLELALSYLFEGRQAFFPTAVVSTMEASPGKGILQPSSRVVKKFSQQLQMLLKTMLGAASSKNRKNLEIGYRGDALAAAARGSDVVKLKEMYRRALKSSDEPDLQVLFQMWMS